MICFVEDENHSVDSSGPPFAVPASSPLDEPVAPYELRAGSFLSNGLRRWWGIEQREKACGSKVWSVWHEVLVTGLTFAVTAPGTQTRTPRVAVLHDKRQTVGRRQLF